MFIYVLNIFYVIKFINKGYVYVDIFNGIE